MHITSKRSDLNAKFVSQHPWIGEERLIPLKRVVVGTADSDSSDADNGLGGCWRKWIGHGECADFSWSFKNDASHLVSLSKPTPPT
jgi:hypothetical protein